MIFLVQFCTQIENQVCATRFDGVYLLMIKAFPIDTKQEGKEKAAEGATAADNAFELTCKLNTRGPFLEHPGNFAGPKSHFKNHEAFYVECFYVNRFCI